MTQTRFAAVLFLSAWAFFAVFTPMGNVPSDTEYSIATAQSIVHRFSLAIDENTKLPHLVMGRDGRRYSKYGIGYALLFTPAIILSDIAGHIAPGNRAYVEQFILSFTNTFLSAIIIVVFYLIFIALGYSRKVILCCLAFIAAASPLLPYSKIIHAEIPTAFLVLVFMLLAIKSNQCDTKFGLPLGLIAACLLLLKPGNVFYGAIICAYGAVLCIRKKGGGAGIALLALPVATALCIMIGLNIMRFGSPLNAGYGVEQTLFTTPVLHGLAGLLFSPSKSLFIFSPLVIACLVAFPSFFKRHTAAAILILCMFFSNIVFYAAWHDWHGGWSWGPRLIVPAILLLHIALPEFITTYVRRSILYGMIFIFLVTAGAAINVCGSLVWYQQLYHFHHDYSSVKYSHPAIAAALLYNKIRNRPEIYALKDFGRESSKNEYTTIFKVAVRNDSVDFSDFEKFQGLATMWDGIRRNFHVPFLWMVPIVFFSCSSIGMYVLWHSPPCKTEIVTRMSISRCSRF